MTQLKENQTTDTSAVEIPNPLDDRIYLVDGKLKFEHYPQKHVTIKYMKAELQRLNQEEFLTSEQEVLYGILSQKITQHTQVVTSKN